jgi:hypothetical protein
MPRETLKPCTRQWLSVQDPGVFYRMRSSGEWRVGTIRHLTVSKVVGKALRVWQSALGSQRLATCHCGHPMALAITNRTSRCSTMKCFCRTERGSPRESVKGPEGGHDPMLHSPYANAGRKFKDCHAKSTQPATGSVFPHVYPSPSLNHRGGIQLPTSAFSSHRAASCN